ncbi:hypothetical protein OEZ66_42620, partial [Escherichia coli]|nr:hypothetical protein [Escherichia coli]
TALSIRSGTFSPNFVMIGPPCFSASGCAAADCSVDGKKCDIKENVLYLPAWGYAFYHQLFKFKSLSIIKLPG